MKNELGMLKAIRNDIATGYGLGQLMAKENISNEDMGLLCTKYPDFGNEIERRYGVRFSQDAKAEPKKEKKQEVSELSPIKAKAKELKIKAWNLKSEETLAKEISELEDK